MDAIAAILVVIIASLAGLGGVFLGAHISLQSLTRSHETEQRERVKARELHLRSIRVLLHVEIQQNLDTLKDLRGIVYAQRDGEEVDFQAQAEFMAAPLPAWGRLMFDSLAHDLPEALSLETVRRVYTLYWHLDRLNHLQQILLAKSPPRLIPDFLAWLDQYHLDHAQGRGTNIDSWVHYTKLKRFKADTQDIWNECLGIINGLAIGGNPVPEQ